MHSSPEMNLRPGGTDDECVIAFLPDWFVVREVTGRLEREAVVALLAETGHPETDRRGIAEGARVFASCDPAAPHAEAVVAAAVLVPRAEADAELTLIAVTPAVRGRRLANRLLAPVADVLRAEGLRRIVASMRRDEPELTSSLKGMGFRPMHDVGGDGRVWLELEL